MARLSKNSSNSSKPPSSDIVKPPKPDSPQGPRRQGGQPGHPGANRPPFRPDQINHVEELHPTRCPHGHDGELEPTGQTKVQQVAELREDPLEITEYRLHGYRCSVCGEVVWAERPPGVVEGQLFGPRLQALIAYRKGSPHAGYTGLADFCGEVPDIDVGRSHLCKTIERVSDALAGPYEGLAGHLPQARPLGLVATGDSTGRAVPAKHAVCLPLSNACSVPLASGQVGA